MATAYLVAEEGRWDLLGALIDNLGDRDESVRFVTAIALRRLTGEDFDYRSYAPLAEREEAIARWRRWLAEPARATPAQSGPGPAAPAPSPGTVSADRTGGRP